MNYQTAALATALLLHAGSLHAQEVVSVPSGTDRIVPVRKGEAAPFDGQLFDNDTSLRWANWLVQYKNLVKSNKELDQKVCEADTDLQKKKLDLLQQQYDSVTADLQKKLAAAQAEASDPPWYRTATFGLVVGIVGTVAAGVGAAALLGAAK